jgi:hypothetical protein
MVNDEGECCTTPRVQRRVPQGSTTRLPVLARTSSNLTDRPINDELGRMRKEKVAAYFRYYSDIRLEENNAKPH